MFRRSFLIILWLLTSTAHAWGTQGHQVIANLAYVQLTIKAKAEVDRLLALEPGATLASISTWADETRNKTTAPWHYVNFPRDTCTYDAARDCPEGQCVVGAIDKQLAILASTGPGEKRLNALKYIVHLVADVHQPLHAGYADDRGGNTYQVQAFGRGTNLHAMWDSGLIENMRLDTAAMTTKLLAMPIHADDLNAAHAAEESCRIVGTQGFYPERKVGPEYVERFTPVMEKQLAAAGVRLAAILNGLFRSKWPQCSANEHGRPITTTPRAQE
jgi:nuclease S1